MQPGIYQLHTSGASKRSGKLDYCFLTRILPLNDSSSTEDEPELEVPEKERPWVGEKVMWDLF